MSAEFVRPTVRRGSPLTVAIALASFLFSCYFLAVRNIYDDEFISYRLIVMPVAQLWATANSEDFHPPGMYLLSHAFYVLTGSGRWMTLGPLAIFYAGLFYFALRFAPLVAGDRRALLLFLAVAFLHPQLLMWSNSVRWYPYWTGLALAVLALTLAQRSRTAESAPRANAFGDGPPGWGAALLAAVLLGCMCYLNYLTIMFAAALAFGWLLRYRWDRASVLRLAAVLGLAFLISAGQWRPFLEVHTRDTSYQRRNPVVAAARLAHGVFVGEALTPWHPLAPIVLLTSLVVGWVLVRRFWRHARGAASWAAWLTAEQSAAAGLFGVLAVLFAGGTFSGLGGKPRSFLLLPVLWALLMAWALRGQKPGLWRGAVNLLAAAWIGVGVFHLAVTEGTAKANLNEHVRTVTQFLVEQAADRRTIVFTWDGSLAYELNDAARRLGRPWTVCATMADPVHGAAEGETGPTQDVALVCVVRTHLYGDRALPRIQRTLAAFEAADALIARPATARLDFDPDYTFKKQIPFMRSESANLPEYRFELTYGPPKRNADWASVSTAVRQANALSPPVQPAAARR